MSPIVPDYNNHRHYDNQGWQSSNFDTQVPEQRFSNSAYNNSNVNNPNFLHVLDSYSSKQALTQMTLYSIQEYYETNKDASIPLLGYTEMVAEKTGIDTLEVAVSILKGLVLGDINAINIEGHLTLYSFRQRLIEHYSNVPYASDAMFTYSHLSQGNEEPTTHYLSTAKVLLECIHHTTKLSSIPGVG